MKYILKFITIFTLFYYTNSYENIKVDKDIIIAGGGLSGLATCLKLRKIGYNAIIIEKSKELRNISQGTLALFPNGLKALEYLDIKDDIILNSVSIQSTINIFRYINGTETFKLGYNKDDNGIFIKWDTLHKIISNNIKEDKVKWLINNSLVLNYYEKNNIVYVKILDLLNNKIKILKCYILIGTDGIFSNIRKKLYYWTNLFGFDNIIKYKDININSIVNINNEKLLNKLPGIGKGYIINTILPDSNIKILCVLINCGNSDFYWLINMSKKDGRKYNAPNKIINGYGGLGIIGIKSWLLGLFNNYTNNDIKSIISKTNETNIYSREIISRKLLNKWSSNSGKIIIIGDAAHAMHPILGQGANQALEDVAILTNKLQNISISNNNNIKYVINNFENIRISRANDVLKLSEYYATKNQKIGKSKNMKKIENRWEKNFKNRKNVTKIIKEFKI